MKIEIEPTFQHVTWILKDFFELPQKGDSYLDSPEFLFSGETYCLRLYPEVNRSFGSRTELHVQRLTVNFPKREVSCKFGIRWRESTGDDCYDYEVRASEENRSYPRSWFDEHRYRLLPDGSLTMVCSMWLSEDSRAGSSAQEEGDQRGFPGIRKLQSDYGQLLQKGTESDACVVVCGKEFKVHKNVLRARSTVFEAMFGHETTEKESGRVVVDDLDPDTFGDFLEYLYTGKVQDKLSDDNVFGLYVAADKYEVSTLKSDCLEHIRRTLSVDSFCDVMTLALRHREKELLQQAISFFKDNLQHIIITSKWQQFMSANSTSANELFIKALVPGKQ